ncbi:magnesium transporter [Aureimonas sp. AU4]|uniref:magnesium transporter n=1 Tax=Aureimonas sp. AU4 TaxID=1638163 RepID=UPI001FCD5068|nr:magnesium transporter [Aureimonas sp. AU4]
MDIRVGDTRMLAAHEAASDLVDRLNSQPLEKAVEAIEASPMRLAVDALDQPEFAAAADVLAALAPARAARLVNEMSADRAADVLAEIPDEARTAIVTQLPVPVRTSLNALLAYPRDTAGGMMTTEFVAMPDDATVAQTLDHVRTVERSRETIYAIYVLDHVTGRLRGTVSLRQLVIAAPDMGIAELARDPTSIKLRPDTDREEVARIIRRRDLLAAPVVDADDRMLGIVTVDDVIDAIVEEHNEDTQKFGGVAAFDESYLKIGFWPMIGKRAGWLSALFLSEMLTASAMQHFETELERAVLLTLFIPLIMSSGGNSGSQATSLIIRALAVGELRLRDWWRVVLREVPTGVVLGTILGVVGMLRIALWQQLGFYDYGTYWHLIALTVGLGLVGIVTFGSVAGSLLPFALQRLGFDPASASAPFVATLVDVTGLVIYFSVALAVLSGTLL